MRIAIETDDGVHLSLLHNVPKSFQIYEVPGNSFLKNLGLKKSLVKKISNRMITKSPGKQDNFIDELTKCSTVISHGMNRSLLKVLKKSEVDVFISFRDKIDEALNHYLKDRIIHDY